jgi:hypothetical protein
MPNITIFVTKEVEDEAEAKAFTDKIKQAVGSEIYTTLDGKQTLKTGVSIQSNYQKQIN